MDSVAFRKSTMKLNCLRSRYGLWKGIWDQAKVCDAMWEAMIELYTAETQYIRRPNGAARLQLEEKRGTLLSTEETCRKSCRRCRKPRPHVANEEGE